MRITILLLSAAFMISCNRQPYVEHKLALEQSGTDCSKLQPSFRLTSNFGGERFEFQKCLPAGFNEKSLVAQRKGDTVLVNFNAGKNASTLYLVTLDIDSYPSYRYITIDNETYAVTPADE